MKGNEGLGVIATKNGNQKEPKKGYAKKEPKKGYAKEPKFAHYYI